MDAEKVRWRKWRLPWFGFCSHFLFLIISVLQPRGFLIFLIFFYHISLCPQWFYVFYLTCFAFVILLFLASTWSKAVTKMNEIFPSCLFIFILFAAHADHVSFKIAHDHWSLFPILLCIARNKSSGLPLCGKSSFSPLDSQI